MRIGPLLVAFLVAPKLSAQSVAITHITVIDVREGQRRADQTVLLDGDRIRAVGNAASVVVPRGARIVDGRGKTLIPGLWDMHVHLGMSGRSSLAILVANGVTGVRDMGGAFARVHAWRDSIATGSLIGPRIEMVGRIVENAQWLNLVRRMLSQSGDTATANEMSDRVAVATPDEARAAVAAAAALGVSLVKVRNDPPAPAYFALLREAKRRGMRVVGHPPDRGPSLADASDSGQASIEHLLISFNQRTWASTLDAMSPEQRSDLLARLHRNHTALVPTLVAGVGFRRTPDSVALAIIADSNGAGDPRRRYVSSELVRRWQKQVEMKKLEGPQPDWSALSLKAAANLRSLDSAGVAILAGTDLGTPLVYPGFGLHDELARLVREGGLSPARALWSATLGPAHFFGLDSVMGTVAPGMRADLVLLDGDPLTDIASVGRIRAVVMGGRLMERPELDRMMEEAAKAR